MEALTANGLVTKKILKQGKPGEPPSFGSQVTIHYVGRLLDGTVFESTCERNKPVKFTLGAGEAIQGAVYPLQVYFARVPSCADRVALVQPGTLRSCPCVLERSPW